MIKLCEIKYNVEVSLMKKIFYFLFTFLFILSSSNLCFAQESKEKKAIIFVPGVLTSGLVYNGNDSSVYKDNEAIFLSPDNENKMRNMIGIKKFLAHYSDIFCDDNGYPINKQIGLSRSNNFPSKFDKSIIKYGYGNSCKSIMKFLSKNYDIKHGGNYNVILFNYDWRLDCSYNANLLKDQILNYDEVILIGYSCGGLVSCKAARELYDIGKLDRVKHFISLATPFNGSVDSFYTLEHGIKTDNDMTGQLMKKMHIPEIFKNFACNCTATYQLLPTKRYFLSSQAGYIESSDKELLNYDDTINFIKNQDYYKDKNGNNKKHLEAAESFHNSLWLDDNTHILNKMDSYLIVGSGYKTMSKMSVSSDNTRSIDISNYTDGDGTVALNESAIVNCALDSKRIFKFNCTHSQIINNDNILNLIAKII